MHMQPAITVIMRAYSDLIVSILYRRCEGCGHWLGLMNWLQRCWTVGQSIETLIVELVCMLVDCK